MNPEFTRRPRCACSRGAQSVTRGREYQIVSKFARETADAVTRRCGDRSSGGVTNDGNGIDLPGNHPTGVSGTHKGRTPSSAS